MKEISKALLEFQKSFNGVEKTRENPFTKSMYASLDDVVRAATPELTKAGIYVSQPLKFYGDKQFIATELVHIESGEIKTSELDLSLLIEKASAQGFGSALTYARRYALCSMLNVVEASDDDGNANEEQLKGDAITKLNLYASENHTEIELYGFVDTLKKKYGEEFFSMVLGGIDKGMKTKTGNKIAKGRQQYFDYLNIYKGDDELAQQQAENDLTDLEKQIIKRGLK